MLLLLRFSVPMMLTNVLMVLYTFADSVIVGRVLGVEAFAAVGATGMLYFMVFSIMLGLGHGFGIVLAQRFGAKDMDGVRSAFVTGNWLVAVIGIITGIVGVFCSGLFLEWLDTPKELMPEATVYMAWLLGGMYVTFLNLFIGGTTRALGDSRTPLIAMIVSSAVNIALNLALVVPFGVAGIAFATLFAQLVSAVHCYIVLRRSGVLRGDGLNWHTPTALKLLRLGLPMGFRNAVIQGGGVVVQWFVNGYQDIALIAGISIAKRMYSLILVAGNAFEAAAGTFVAQNFGAGKIERLKKGFAVSRWLMLGAAGIMMALIVPLARVIIGLFFDGDPAIVAATLDYGSYQLIIMSVGLPLLHMLVLHRSALEGVGKPLIPVISGFVELVFRIGSIFLLTPLFGVFGVLLSDAAGWVGAVALLIISYIIVIGKLEKEG